MIEVILLERIDRLGQLGQVVKVKPGYARNFLLPHKKALRATKANIELFDKKRKELETQNVAAREQAELLAKKMDNLKLVIIRQASEMGQLYGSVGSRDVVDSAKDAGHVLERMQVQIDTPIKSLGLFPIKVKLHPEVSIKVTVNVARSPEEAVVQAEKGAALVKANAVREAEEKDLKTLEAIGPNKEAASSDEEKPAKKKTKAPKAETVEEAKPEAKAKKPRAKKAANEG